MGRISKRFKESSGRREVAHLYPVGEAFELLKGMPDTKFDESVDLAINLGVDPKHADQMVRGAIVMPHGTGRTVRVLVFAKGDKEAEAREAGADHVGGDELAKKIQDGWFDFDRVIATPGYDGRGRSARPRVGPARPDAEPEAWHRDTGCRACGQRAEVWQD